MKAEGAAVWSKSTWRGQRVLLGMLLAFGAILLAGCGAGVEYDIHLYTGEEWKAQADIALSSAQVAMAGGEAALDARLEDTLEEKGQGDVEWERIRGEDQLIYRASMEGEGWDDLNEELFDGQATIETREGGKIYFSFEPMWFGLAQLPLRLHGRRIVSSNADEVEDGTAVWHDVFLQGRAEAVLTPARRSLIRFPSLNLGSGFLKYAGIILGVAVVLYFILRPGRANL